jgi:hypothetical protein
MLNDSFPKVRGRVTAESYGDFIADEVTIVPSWKRDEGPLLLPCATGLWDIS